MTGILYILMLAHWRFTAARDPSSRMRQLVLGTLDYCCSIRLPSGNFPSSEHDEEDYEPSDKLVQVSSNIRVGEGAAMRECPTSLNSELIDPTLRLPGCAS